MMRNMTPGERTRWIAERARAIGFDLCGVVSLGTLRDSGELQRLPQWLERGYAGDMTYLNDPRRADPELIVEGARSAIVVALNYNTPHPYSIEAVAHSTPDTRPSGWISRYAWGDDYHDVLGEKLEALLAAMRAEFAAGPTGSPFAARAYVDTGPVLERVAAKYAGLGWLAKNTCVINQQLGSWLFLGVIVASLDLEPTLSSEQELPADLCGNCTLCLEACPTGAFAAPYLLDARRCISYLTIELRGSIPEELRPAMGSAIFGCDICQDVCPWNSTRRASLTQAASFQPRNAGGPNSDAGISLLEPALESLATLTQQDFSKIFRGSAIKRAKWRGLVRNACVALGNAKFERDSETRQRVLMLLSKLVDGDDPLIAEHARWALARLQLEASGTSFASPTGG
jgi:epoxyqueuosine reductase